MREEQVGSAARAQVYVLDPLHAGATQLPLRHRAEVEHAAARNAVEIVEGRQDLLAHLVAAGAYAGTDGSRGRRLEALDRPLDDPRGQAAPAAVEHCRPPVA